MNWCEENNTLTGASYLIIVKQHNTILTNSWACHHCLDNKEYNYISNQHFQTTEQNMTINTI